MSIFNEAIETHAEWKLTLIKHFNEGMAIDDAKAIQNSHLCELGRWIDGRVSTMPICHLLNPCVPNTKNSTAFRLN